VLTILRTVRLAALALALSLAAAGPALAATDREQSNAYLDEAKSLLGKGDAAAAVIQLKNALQSDPKNVAARYLLGEVYLRVGDGASAEKELRRARAAGLDEPRVTTDLGQAYLLQGKYQAVLDEIASGDRGPDTEAEILLLRGQAYLGLGRIDESLAALNKVVTMRPDTAAPRVALARALIAKGDYAGAEKAVDTALAGNPKAVQALTVKGELRRLAGDLKGGLAAFDRALATAPNHLAARIGRAAVLIDLNRDDEASSELDRIAKKAPKLPVIAYLRALVAAKKGDYRTAEDLLIGAGPALEGHLPSMFLLGAVHYARGELEQAENRLSKYIEAVPNQPAARKILAAVLVRKGQADRAVEVLKPVLKSNPNDPQAVALMGTAYMKLRAFTKATEYFQRAAKLSPNAAAIRTQLALSRLATGQSKAAVADLEAAVEKNPDSLQAGILLTLTHLRSHDYDAALAVADGLAKRFPDNPLPQNFRGAALLGKKDNAGARAAFEKALAINKAYFPAQMNLAQLALVSGDVDGARRRYKAILEQDGKHVNAMIALSELAQREGKTDEAVSWLERARQRNPTALSPRLRLVNLFLSRKQGDKALGVARELEGIKPNNAQVLDALARAQVAAGEPNSAVATYRRLQSLMPKSGQVYHRLAAVQVAAGDLDGARDTLAEGVKVAPDYKPLRIAQVEVEIKAGRADAALALAVAFRDAHPDAAIAHRLVGDALVKKQAFGDAATAYREALKRKPSANVVLRLHAALLSAGDIDGATKALESWLADHPDDGGVRFTLAGAYLAAKHYKDAVRHYERLLTKAPDNPVLLNNLAWSYQELGDDRAVAVAEKAHKLMPDSVQVIDTYGWILVRSGKASRGLELLRKASAMAPQEPEIRYHLAVALNDLGDTKAARNELDTILRTGKDFGAAGDARKLLKSLGGG